MLRTTLMSTTSASHGGRRYEPLPPPKVQMTFTAKRRTAKPPSSVPSLNKKQSSLTQMQWVGTPRAKEIISIPSGDDDSDYEERPAKRQKKNAGSGSSGKRGKKTKLKQREAGQNTFTQVPYLTRMGGPRRSAVDKDGFQIWQDSDTEDEADDSMHIVMKSAPKDPTASRDEGLENEVPEIAESSQNASDEAQHEPVIRPEIGNEAVELRTPHKVRLAEIPSSQTPPSTKFSTQRTVTRQRSISRSPLKERSANVWIPMKKLQSPESQHMSMKMLERTRFANHQVKRQAAAENQTDADLEQCAAEGADEFSLRTCRMPPPPSRHLRRMATIQDSQMEDESALSVPFAADTRPALQRSGTIADSQTYSSNESIAEDSQLHSPRRTLRRVATVQDSQMDDDDTLIPNESTPAVWPVRNERMSADDDDDDNSETNEDYPEGTFDPAFSALDRDARRFTWTQTQHLLPATNEDSETEDEHLDRGCVPTVGQAQRLCSDSSWEVGTRLVVPSHIGSDQHCGYQTEHPDDTAQAFRHVRGSVHGDSAYGSGDQVASTKGIRVPSSPLRPIALGQPLEDHKKDDTEATLVPSSPPPLRASQVSTVVPTQFSAPERPSPPSRPIKAGPFSLAPSPPHERSQALDLTTSPQKTASLWQPESLSSSPLPLPPWTSPPGEHRMLDVHRGRNVDSEPQMDSLADFSLPPPPPLSSSRTETPASSSSAL